MAIFNGYLSSPEGIFSQLQNPKSFQPPPTTHFTALLPPFASLAVLVHLSSSRDKAACNQTWFSGPWGHGMAPAGPKEMPRGPWGFLPNLRVELAKRHQM